MLTWAVLFPILWALMLASLREDGHTPRMLTYIVFAVWGGAMWLCVLFVGVVIWFATGHRRLP